MFVSIYRDDEIERRLFGLTKPSKFRDGKKRWELLDEMERHTPIPST